MNDSNTQKKSDKKVAVIAVHGISDQKPFDSAKQVTDLLVTLKASNNDNQNKYNSFDENIIRIPVNSIEPSENLERNTQPIFPDERGAFIDKLINKDIDKLINDNTDLQKNINVDIDLTKDYLSSYKDSNIYQSIVLKGKREAKDDNENNEYQDVHVYEMYWADLSRLGTGFLEIFSSLYQLLFHVLSLGRPVVDIARIKIRESLIKEESDRQSIKDIDSYIEFWGRIQLWNGRILNMIIPILNLFILIALLISIPSNQLSFNILNYINYFAIVVFINVCVYYIVNFLTKNSTKSFFRSPYFIFPVLFLVTLISVILIGFIPSSFVYIIISAIWTSILIFACYIFLLNPYKKYRPGILKVSLISAIVLIASILFSKALGIFVIPSNLLIKETIFYLSLNLAELIYLLLHICWFLFIALYVFNSFIGIVLRSGLNPSQNKIISFINYPVNFFAKNILKKNLNVKLENQDYKKFTQARFISVVALSFPAFLFLVITAFLWSATYTISSKLNLLIDIDYTPKYMKGLGHFMNLAKESKVCTSNSDCFLRVLSDFSSTPFAIVFLGLILAIILLALLTLLPSLITEIFPPKQNSNNDSAYALGRWLTQGYEITIICIDFLICTLAPTFLVIAMFLSLDYLFDIKFWKIDEIVKSNLFLYTIGLSRSLLIFAGAIIVASTGSLVAFGNRLRKIALGLRSVLDAILDVDNYLRLYPEKDNPRARIFARYESLLRYICKNDKYDSIVIIAHSQGTVITADLLRYLEVNKPDFKDNIPNIYLFTMGSPIKQLYSFAFPHLYDWVYNSSKDEKINPNPDELLMVKQWVNAYRSGDYVGRYLWHEPETNEFNTVWDPVIFSDNNEEKNIYDPDDKRSSNSKQTIRREFCIGTGGHTHYWDETAPEIAIELDRLIKEAEKI